MVTETALVRFAEDFGTPLYVFDTRELAPRACRISDALPSGTGLCYAVKANTFVLGALAGLVTRLEVCSPGEQRICRALGVPEAQLVVSGVSKDPAALGEVLSARELPAAVTVESPSQLGLVRSLAAERGRRAPVLLRLSSGNQFGLDRADLLRAARDLADDPYLELRGVQFFSGTQKSSARRLRRELAGLDALMLELGQACGRPLPELEYGPGLPVAYFEGDAVDEEELLAALSEGIEGLSCRARMTLELGRSLVAGCGTYLTRVTDTKTVAGQRYAIVDGGMHQIVYYGQSLAMRRPPVRLLGDPRGEGDGERNLGTCDAPGDAAGDALGLVAADAPAWNVCGSLCTVNDILVKQLPLPGLAEGSLLAFARAGAYCATEGMSLFLSRDLPRVVLVGADGAPELVRAGVRTDPLNTPRAARP